MSVKIKNYRKITSESTNFSNFIYILALSESFYLYEYKNALSFSFILFSIIVVKDLSTTLKFNDAFLSLKEPNLLIIKAFI